MKLMQLYSDRAGSEIVSEAGARLRAQTGKKCTETVWNTELLRNAKLRMIAAREAAEADLIMIVVREGERLSPEMRQWLQLWKTRKRKKRPTLIALLQRERTHTPRTVERALHSFARTAKMDFFCHSRIEQTQARPALEVNLSFLV